MDSRNILIEGNVILGSGAVLDGADVGGRVIIRGTNVTVRNCRIRGTRRARLHRLGRRLAGAFRTAERISDSDRALIRVNFDRPA